MSKRYLNPAAAVGTCRRQGKKDPHEVYTCALQLYPQASPGWIEAAKRTVGLSGAVKRKRKPGRKRR